MLFLRKGMNAGMKNKAGSELPIGFAMELAMDMDAMEAFAALESNEQQKWIDGAKKMNTRDAMHDYVARLGSK